MSVRSAALDPTVLVDDLVTTIDELRTLQIEMGIRPYRMFGVTRVWQSGQVGDGPYSDTLEEFLPRPKVEPFEQLENRLRPCGLDEAGLVKLSEVSLANDYTDLVGAPAGSTLPASTERIYLLREGYGQGQPDRYFTLDRPPFPDREKTLGWLVWLRRVR